MKKENICLVTFPLLLAGNILLDRGKVLEGSLMEQWGKNGKSPKPARSGKAVHVICINKYYIQITHA